MPRLCCALFPRFTLYAFLLSVSAGSYAGCDFLKGCGDGEDTPFESTQMSGFMTFTTTMASFDATSDVSGGKKRVYSVKEIEAARYFLATDGMLQAAYFTSALHRFRQESSQSMLDDLAVAALISTQ
ncbi:DUF2388 domain-containing protein [Pseudomonas sp. SWRI153]|uniref:DUF2388 domain-containing protein n=2 Tax=Pseudomonas khorasanensis TaxID=2745508 RepID=A0A923F8P0_9PSED|nr:DUF2388 domain-containing protein [Pseudomonas khorasanensis]